MVVTLWQILANLTKLFFDDVKIINQPLSGRGNSAAISDRFNQSSVSGKELSAVVFKTRQELCASSFFHRLVFDGKTVRQLLQPLDAENFCADGLFVGRA